MFNKFRNSNYREVVGLLYMALPSSWLLLLMLGGIFSPTPLVPFAALTHNNNLNRNNKC